VIEQPTVVYTDILGFSALVMSMAGAIGLLDGFYYSSMSLTSGLHRAESWRFSHWSRDQFIFDTTNFVFHRLFAVDTSSESHTGRNAWHARGM